MRKRADWLNDPEYLKLLEFLVEKTKEVKQVLNVLRLATEFKEQVNLDVTIGVLSNRIQRFRFKILDIPHFDTETKVKLAFGLSAPVDHGFLRELKNEAKVTVDDLNRITHYKRKGGGLELKGKHHPQHSELSNNRILMFLAKKVEETSGIIALHTLAKKFKAETGSSKNVQHLLQRFSRATKQIYESELFDENMKVRMMFATRTKVEDYALEELRQNATVVVDEKNRIEEYKKKDGSLYLNKKDSHVKRGSRNNTVDESDDVEDFDEDDEESGDDSEEEEVTMEVKTRSGRISKKRFSDASFINSRDDVESSSPRNERSKSSNIPTISNKKRKILDHRPESTRKKKETRERAAEEDYDNDYSIDFSYQPDGENRVKLEPFKGPLNDDTTRTHIINNEENFVEEIPAPTENFVAPKYEEMLLDVKMEEPDVIILDEQIDEEIKEEQDSDVFDHSEPRNSSNNQFKNGSIQQDSTSSEDVKEDHTSLALVLESFHDLIDTLDIPILSDLQKKIEAKLEECKNSSTIHSLLNREIDLSLELCLLKVNKNSELKKTVESFSMETFMTAFRHALVHIKCSSLVEFQEKLKKIIGELRVQNKFIPVTAIRSALQSVIDNIINS